MNPALLAAMRPRVRFVTQPSDTAPGQPPNLRTTSVSSDAVALAWNAPGSGGEVTGYDLLRGGVVIQSGLQGLSAVDSSVTPGTGYSYTVRAVGPGGVGPESDALAVTVPSEDEGEPVTMLHGVSGPVSSSQHRVKFKSAADASGVRLAYSTDPTLQSGVQYTAPQDLDAANYRTGDFLLTGLTPDTEYFWAPYGGGELSQFQGHYGRFRTAPVGPKSFTFAFGNCNQYSGGQPRDLTVWDHIRQQAPDFIAHLDDFHYADLETTDVAPRVAADEQQMGMPRQGAAYMRVPLVRGMGDHDFCGNDSYGGRGSNPAPGRFAAAEAYRITMPTPELPHSEGMYYAFTWGRVRFLKLDGRYFRDSRWYTGSTKSMLGTEQRAWFEAEVTQAADDIAAGDLALVVVLGDVPWTGNTGDDDADHWEGYEVERAALAEHIEQAGMTGNLYWIVGDMHRMGYDDGTNTRFSATNAGQPAFPSACGGSFGNAQGLIKGAWTNVESSNGENRVGFITVSDDGGDEVTVTTSLRVVNASTPASYTEPLGSFEDTFACEPYGGGGGDVEPLFEDSFESGDLSHTANGFSWSGEWAPVYVSSARARTGNHSLAFDFTQGRAEETFHLGGQYPRVWLERWIWIPADYAHGSISGSTTNNKFFAMYGQTYGGNGTDRAQMILELWDIGGGDSRLRVMANPHGGPTGFTQGNIDPFISDAGPVRRGHWNRIRLHADVGTPGEPDDGIIRIWAGNDLIYNQTDVPFYPAGGTHPYFEHGYLWGANNGDYAVDTIFFEDDFAVFTSDPGWL